MRHDLASCFQEFTWNYSLHTNGPFHDCCINIQLCIPTTQELIALHFLHIQELSHEITLSQDCSGMQNELLHHFVTIPGKNMDTGLSRSIILPCILNIKQLPRTPSHPAEPLPFAYHEVMIMLRDTEITHVYLWLRSWSYHSGLHAHPRHTGPSGCSSAT
jgi:hypothetical protein